MLAEKIASVLKNARILDPVADAEANLVNKLLKPGKVKSVLSGTPIGHPLHPALVAVPIGAFSAVSVLDLAGGRQSRKAATRLTGFGLLAALPTAAAGLSDWADTDGAERRVGFVHAVANTTALLAYTASWRARHRGEHARGVGLALVGAGALGAGGWLGGHLSYALGVGVDTTAFQAGPTDWTDAGAEVELTEGGLVGADVDGVPVLLTRHGGRVVALADRCTHRGAPLHEGTVSDGCVQCPWHASRFRLVDGDVVQGPATQPQKVYETRVVDGRVQVRRQDLSALASNAVGAG